jgi:probable rRNA maturation factor
MHYELENISISVDKKTELKSLAFLIYVLEIKNTILGSDYELSINFVNQKEAKKINIKYRQKDYIPNTLSFPYSDTSGEIFLQLEAINSQAKDFDLSKENFLLKIYIHSLLHLKGLDHSTKMDNLEAKFLNKYMV